MLAHVTDDRPATRVKPPRMGTADASNLPIAGVLRTLAGPAAEATDPALCGVLRGPREHPSR